MLADGRHRKGAAWKTGGNSQQHAVLRMLPGIYPRVSAAAPLSLSDLVSASCLVREPDRTSSMLSDSTKSHGTTADQQARLGAAGRLGTRAEAARGCRGAAGAALRAARWLPSWSPPTALMPAGAASLPLLPCPPTLPSAAAPSRAPAPQPSVQAREEGYQAATQVHKDSYLRGKGVDQVEKLVGLWSGRGTA